MNWFPQTESGCLVQLPLHRRYIRRAITNELENGERISTPDPNSARIEWKLAYKDLSATEAATLNTFFLSMRGAFGMFAFADPTANLLGGSEDLTRPEWQKGLITLGSAAAGPGGAGACARLVNPAGGAQQLSQTVAIPGEYTACFSAWLRCGTPSPVTLFRGTQSQAVAVGPAWKRVFITGTIPGEDDAPFGITLEPGQSVDVWGLQFEAGPYPSQYMHTVDAGGLHERTSFAADELEITATGCNLFATEFTLISRL